MTDTLVTDVGGRTVVTGHVEIAAATGRLAGNPNIMWLTGRFVEAGRANINGAFWDVSDLAYGEATVAYTPLNFLHRSRHIVGSYVDAKLHVPVAGAGTSEAAAAALRPYIAATAGLWRWLFPHEARMVEIANANHNLYFSMECQPEQVVCETSADGTRQGCGKSFPGLTAIQALADPSYRHLVCEHVRERASQRRQLRPTFTAGAVILPPVRPAWREATAEVRKRVEAAAESTFAEAAGEGDDAAKIALMAEIVRFGDSLNDRSG